MTPGLHSHRGLGVRCSPPALFVCSGCHSTKPRCQQSGETWTPPLTQSKHILPPTLTLVEMQGSNLQPWDLSDSEEP